MRPLSRPVIRFSAHHRGQQDEARIRSSDITSWMDPQTFCKSTVFIKMLEYQGFGHMHQGMSMSLDSSVSTVTKADLFTFSVWVPTVSAKLDSISVAMYGLIENSCLL